MAEETKTYQAPVSSILPAIQSLNEYVFRILPIVKELKEEKSTGYLVNKYSSKFVNTTDTNELMALFSDFVNESSKLNNRLAVNYISPIIQTKLSDFNEIERIERELSYKNKSAEEVLPALEEAYRNNLVVMNGQIKSFNDYINSDIYKNISPVGRLTVLDNLTKNIVKVERNIDPISDKIYVVYKNQHTNEILKSESYDLINGKGGLYYIQDGKETYLDDSLALKYREYKRRLSEQEGGQGKLTAGRVKAIHTDKIGDYDVTGVLNVDKDGNILFEYYNPTEVDEDGKLKQYTKEEVEKFDKNKLVEFNRNLTNKAIAKRKISIHEYNVRYNRTMQDSFTGAIKSNSNADIKSDLESAYETIFKDEQNKGLTGLVLSNRLQNEIVNAIKNRKNKLQNVLEGIRKSLNEIDDMVILGGEEEEQVNMYSNDSRDRQFEF